ISPAPAATIADVLIDAPSKTTAISSSILAEKLMPLVNLADGRKTDLMAVPSKIASTSASSHARPKISTSTISSPTATSATPLLSSTPCQFLSTNEFNFSVIVLHFENYFLILCNKSSVQSISLYGIFHSI